MKKSSIDIVESVKNGGVVGAGGAGFPTHIKIDTKVDYVIANGAECEPLLKVDQQLMEFYPEKIIQGLKLVIKATGAKKGIVALKEKYKNAIESLKKVLKNENNIEIKTLKNFYPAGDEQSLVYNVLGRVVPEMGIPLNVGVVVDNVGTLYNISNSYDGIPVIERFLTISGAVKNPVTISVPIGTPVKDLIELAGGYTTEEPVVINGGPLMGKVIDPLNEYVTKTTTGIIVLPKNIYLTKIKLEPINRSIKLAKTLCIQCNTCTENCPRHLLGHNIRPHLIMRKIGLKAGEIDESFSDALLCCECGVCSYFACPMNLAPHKVIQYIKSELLNRKIKPKKLNQNPVVSNFYNEKLIPAYKLIDRTGLKDYDKPARLIKASYEPEKLRILLLQHIGAPSIPVKKTGEKVKKYELIAEIPEGKIGAKIHSPINGKITKITKNFIEITKE